MKRTTRNFAVYVAFLVLLSASPALAQTAPSLGNAEPFGVLAGSTVTNTGPTVINGDVGVSPGSAIVGFPPGTIAAGRAFHAADATAAAAQVSVTTAYTTLAGQPSTQNLTGQDLGGLTLTSGVYTFNTSAQLTGTLTLNAQGNSSAVFIFQIGSTLTTASGSRVVLINGGSLCNIYWQVGSSATLGTTTTFIGNILAQASITLNTGATMVGRALARTGAVTLDSNTTSATTCAGVPVFPPGTTPPPAGCPVIGITPETLPGATVGVFYSQTLNANSGTVLPYTFSADASTLPAGITLSSAGVLSGTPTSSNQQTFIVRATDGVGCFAEKIYVFRFGVAVPTMPQVLFVLLALGLTAIGYFRLRRSTSLRG